MGERVSDGRGAGLADAVRRLTAAGLSTAGVDAELLARHATETRASLEGLVDRRANHEPLSHILGSVGFRGLRLSIGPGAFVPRGETECVVEAVNALAAHFRQPVIVDMCAGSGALGLAVAQENECAVVHLVEQSEEAFEWLRRNAAGFRERVKIHLADAAVALPELVGAVDIVASNPPYPGSTA